MNEFKFQLKQKVKLNLTGDQQTYIVGNQLAGLHQDIYEVAAFAMSDNPVWIVCYEDEIEG